VRGLGRGGEHGPEDEEGVAAVDDGVAAEEFGKGRYEERAGGFAEFPDCYEERGGGGLGRGGGVGEVGDDARGDGDDADAGECAGGVLLVFGVEGGCREVG